MSEFLSRADRTTTGCSMEIDLDPETRVPTAIRMTVLTGVRGATEKAEKGAGAFDEGIEHVAFHFQYEIDTNREIARFEVPREAAKLLK